MKKDKKVRGMIRELGERKSERMCGNCLMERVEIVTLRPDGRCPICGTKYGAQ